MFPEKIEFDGKKYRTKNYNKVLDFIYQQTNKLQRLSRNLVWETQYRYFTNNRL